MWIEFLILLLFVHSVRASSSNRISHPLYEAVSQAEAETVKSIVRADPTVASELHPLIWQAAYTNFCHRRDGSLIDVYSEARTQYNIRAHTIVNVLLCSLKDMNIPSGKEGFTPLTFAIACKRNNVIDHLLARLNPQAPDIHGRTPLMWAVKTKNFPLIERLLNRYHVDPNILTMSGKSALYYAAQINLQSTRLRAIRLLTKAGARVSIFGKNFPRLAVGSHPMDRKLRRIQKNKKMEALTIASMSFILFMTIFMISYQPSNEKLAFEYLFN